MDLTGTGTGWDDLETGALNFVEGMPSLSDQDN